MVGLSVGPDGHHKHIKTVDYLGTPDGCGGTMKNHYAPGAVPMVGKWAGCKAATKSVVMEVDDDYSSGVHPGFTLPNERDSKVSVALEPEPHKLDLIRGLVAGSKSSIAKLRLEFMESNPKKELAPEFESEVRTRFVTPKPVSDVNVFSSEEWKDMADLIE